MAHLRSSFSPRLIDARRSSLRAAFFRAWLRRQLEPEKCPLHYHERAACGGSLELVIIVRLQTGG